MESSLKIGSKVSLLYSLSLGLSGYFVTMLQVVKVIGSAEVGYIIALLVGIVVANVTRIPSWLKDSSRGGLIKIAIVLLGAKILLTTFVTSAPSILAESASPYFKKDGT